MRLATESDFHGGIYTAYRHHEGYAKRARLLSKLSPPLLIVGCGFGFTVKELRTLGIIAWGIDASWYAFRNRTCGYVDQGDILLGTRIGILGAQYGTVVTEDLLPCLRDDEAQIAATNCASLGQLVIHMVTEQGEADLNYHSSGYWMTLTQQLTVSLEGM
jgi:hypothetical protein